MRTEPIGVLTKGVWVPDEHCWPQDAFCVPRHYRPLIDKVLLPRGQITDRLEKLALDIYEHYRRLSGDVVLVVTLKGAVTVFQELNRFLRRLAHNDCSEDAPDRSCFLEQYVVCSSYSGVTQGVLGVSGDLQKALRYCRGKHVVIVEDLIDTGKTLKRLIDEFSALTAEPTTPVLSVRSVVGFSKRTPKWNGYVPDWVGFDLTDVWIVGFGCDVDNHFRDLDHLATISEAGKARYIENGEVEADPDK